jgi:hypothetical protein
MRLQRPLSPLMSDKPNFATDLGEGLRPIEGGRKSSKEL